MMDSNSSTFRAIIALNIVSLIFAVAFISIGSWVRGDSARLFRLLGDLPADVGASRHFYNVSVNMAFSIGIVIAANNFIAWLSISRGKRRPDQCRKRNKCIYYTTACIVSVWLVTEVIALGLCAAFLADVESIVSSSMLGMLATYGSNYTVVSGAEITYRSESASDRAFDAFQVRFSCCGINNSGDYDLSSIFPVTCCPIAEENKGQVAERLYREVEYTYSVSDQSCLNDTGAIANTKGCYGELKSFFGLRAGLFAGLLSAEIIVQTALICLFLYLGCKSIGRNECTCANCAINGPGHDNKVAMK